MESVNSSLNALKIFGLRLKSKRSWSKLFLFYNSFTLTLWILLEFDFLVHHIKHIEEISETLTNFVAGSYAIIEILIFLRKRNLLEKILMDLQLMDSDGNYYKAT
jgi:hypothetical protein